MMNNMTLTEVLCWSVLSLGSMILIADDWKLSAFIRRQKADTLRYRMFAVRDELVRLVVTGRVDEDDEAWSTTYVAINNVLKAHYELSPLTYIHQYARFAADLAVDPRLRHKAEQHARKIRRLRTQVPEFAQVLDAFDQAIYAAICARNRFWHKWLLLGSAGLLTLFVSGLDAATSLFRTFSAGPNGMRSEEMSFFAANNSRKRAA